MKMRAISKTYGKRTVLNMPAFTFEPGRIYAVVGANGSGKTTLARILADIEKADDGKRPLEADNTARIGYLPQHPYAFRMSARANIRLAGRDDKRADELMEILGIEHLKAARAHHMSGGEIARMALARSMMNDYELLILDEPTIAMDMESTILAEKLILQYREQTGAAIILITHSLSQAERLSDETIFLVNGELAESGPTGELLRHPQQPETQQFIEFYR